ncbi:uncharacterized protein TNCV_1635821 [Trichonephila clavipes]|nr:uncharacterized protein TNCV_1635821 [Trichonephila clavipes]
MEKGQQEMQKSLEDMQKSQGQTKDELKERMEKSLEDMQKGQQEMQKGLENVQKCLEELKDSLEKKINSVEDRIAGKMKEEIAVVEEKMKRKGEADEVLQTLPDTERLNLNSLYIALDLRLCQKYSKDYSRLQMKTRLQKTGESLQEYAFEVERLANLTFSYHPATVREVISLQYFVDGLKEGEIQKAVRMADVQDLKSALLYALKLEAATQASRKDHHSIRGARVIGDEPYESRLIKEMEKLKEEMQTIKAGISYQEKRNFKCWGCGGTGHPRRNCPRSRKGENNVSSSKQEN